MTSKPRYLKGLPVSPGVAIGKIHLFESEDLSFPKYWLPEPSIARELKRFKLALKKTQDDLVRVKDKLCRFKADEQIKIVESHQMIARDEVLNQGTTERIKKQKINAEWAFDLATQEIFEKFPKKFEMNEDYFKDRYEEIKHVTSRILKNLLGPHVFQQIKYKKGSIVVAHDLSPIDTMQMLKGDVLGFVTELGGTTSHTAIVAKSLEIPAVVGIDNMTSLVEDEGWIIIDGNSGEVILNPQREQIIHYQKRQKDLFSQEKALLKTAHLPSITTDGFQIKLAANMELPEELGLIKKYRAEGIGLFRTEMLLLSKNVSFSEEDQTKTYKNILKKSFPHPVTIRTFDLGGDKIPEDLVILESVNPALGLRGIRFSLRENHLLHTQLKAILQASTYGMTRILIPMVTNIEEIRLVKKMLSEIKEDLRSHKIPYSENILLGAMIETPSAAMIAEDLASEVDFFSIGTNDLIQYTLAVDRENDDVSYLYEPLHPAILRLLKMICSAGLSRNIDISLCGEMAGHPLYLILLLGLGLTELSMNASSIPRVKKLLRSLSYKNSQDFLDKALCLKTAQEIESLLKKELQKYSVDD